MGQKPDKKTDREARKSTISRIIKYLKPYAPYAAASLLMAVVTVAGTLYIPILAGRAIDAILGKGKVDFAAIMVIMRRAAVVTLLTALAQWIMNNCNNRITYHVSRDIRNEALAHIEHLPLSYIDSHPYGEVVNQVITDVDQFADGLLMGFTRFFTGIITIFATLGFMFSVHVNIALLVVCLTPISLFVARFIATHTYDMFRLQSETRGEQTALIEEMIGGQKVVKAFGYEQIAANRFDEINDRLTDCSLQATFYSSITNPSTRFVNALVYAAVALLGALTVVSGGLTVGQLTCLLSYANQYTKPFNEISGVITELQNAFACAAHVFALIDESAEEEDNKEAPALPVPTGHVAFDRLYFSYDKNQPLIRDFTLDVKRGQRVAIVGPTGCGKTTIINLLMRFYDADQGSISVEGHDIRVLKRGDLRRSFGMVLQETWLKTGTVRDNITMGSGSYTEEEIIEAAKKAHSWGFIRRMPKGLDTPVYEDGAGMSQGEKQLLCITRVMLKLPSMLILDEATSSIDTRTEQKIQNAFAQMMEGRTSFIVAHRLSTIEAADIILVMKEGRIIEQGNHQSLLTQGGFYAQLYQSQFPGNAG